MNTANLTAPGPGNGDGLCGCGCGKKTFNAARSNATRGIIAGYPTKYLRGHYANRHAIGAASAVSRRTIPRSAPGPGNGDGLCACGCGRATGLAAHSNGFTGVVQGHPLRFVVGHATRTYRSAEGKTCPRCKEFKPWSSYYRARSAKDGHRAYCRTCSRAYREAAKREPRSARRDRMLRRRYGMTLQEYEEMLGRQGGGCAICGRTEGDKTGKSLRVDHCHKTGEVRGLLCNSCNRGLGNLGDDPKRVRAAAEYLERATQP